MIRLFIAFVLTIAAVLPVSAQGNEAKQLPVLAKSGPSAEEIIADAQKVAAKEDKTVLVLFHASWCGWCKKMEKTMSEPEMKPLFEKSFVIRYMTVYEQGNLKASETPGAEDLLKKYKGYDLGIPYFMIFDPKGKLLADSQQKPGENIGCPAEPGEVDYFISMLKRGTKLNATELDLIAARFKKNKE